MMPTIKREDSPEPISSIPSTVSSALPTRDSQDSCIDVTRRGQVESPKVMLPPPKPCAAAKQPRLAYHGSSPSKYRLAALRNNASLKNKLMQPSSLHLPSLRSSAVATGINKRTASTKLGDIENHQNNNNTNLRVSDQAENTPRKQQRKKMDMVDFDGAANYGNGYDFPVFSPSLLNEQDDTTITVPRAALQDLQHEVQQLKDMQTVNQHKAYQQDELIEEFAAVARHITTKMEDLNNRLKIVEASDDPRTRLHQGQHQSALRTNGSMAAYGRTVSRRSRSPSSNAEEYRRREEPGSGRKGRKNLEIQLPATVHMARTAGLPTPNTSFSNNFPVQEPMTPRQPLTPNRAGPPSGSRRANTSIGKRGRGVHNLDKQIPPTNALIPELPLTDTELIVFFFNSLNRPITSLRLYARGWGPASICDVLNAHRIIEPEYLRNTCGVKCITAIKKGEGKYGSAWRQAFTALFEDVENTTDVEATKMIQLYPDEFPRRVDFDMRKLCNGLGTFPDAENGGIFTQCVRYCHEHNLPCKVSGARKLAEDLTNGRTPLLLNYPAEDRDEDGDGDDDDEEDGDDDNGDDDDEASSTEDADDQS